MSLVGQQLGPYQVLAKIGEGGMGEVYRATDTKLGRDVAIKILPEAFAHDRDAEVRHVAGQCACVAIDAHVALARVEAVFTRDYMVIQAVTLCTGVGYLLMSLFADVCYFLVNPRIRTAAWP